MTRTGVARCRPALGVAALVLLAAGCGTTPSPPPTARVDRGDVVVSVSAAGSIVPVGEQKLGFPAGGRVAEVLVKVGDRVGPGQPLARLDDYQLRQTLAQRQATVDEREAVLGRVRGDRSVAAADATLQQARTIQEATEDEVAATEEANSAASERARAELQVEREARAQAENELRAARAACATGTPKIGAGSCRSCGIRARRA